MPRITLPVLQRAIKYMISTIATNDVAINITPFSTNEADREKSNIIAKEIEKIIENAKLKELSRKAIRNGAVDGSSYMMLEFESNYETHQAMKGRIEGKLLDNTQVYFGNPYDNNVQKQPFIIVALRQHKEQVKNEAKELGVPKIKLN